MKARDNHLRKEDYFNTQRFPLIHFESTQFKIDKKSSVQSVVGNLTIKGITKQVTINFNYILQGEKIVFNGNLQINRRDFMVGSGSFVLSDLVNLIIKVTANKLNN